ncbi:unnamed protein product [Calypogeia fissa]
MAQALRADKDVGHAYFDLNSGHTIPALGLGTWKTEPGVVRDAVFSALVEGGYLHIDCAFIYGNQEEVGTGFKAAWDAGIKREDVFITSKLWIKSNSPDKVKPALLQTLNELGLDYLDLYLVHWPIYTTENAGIPPKSKEEVLPYDIVGTWKAMESLVKEGLVKIIGVSNFSVPKLEILLKEATILPAVHQVEMHPAWRNDRILEHAKKNNIHVTAYSPLGSSQVDILDDATTTEIAKKYGKSPAQVILRWCIQHGVSTIPKSSSERRIKENEEVFGWSLSPEDFHKLNSVPFQKRTNPGAELFVPERMDQTKLVSEFWDGDI